MSEKPLEGDVLLELRHVRKSYGDFLAVRDVSFRALRGQMFGFLGPNGAGKSTTMRMIAGILEPSSGEIALFGAPINRAALMRTGYLPEERGIYKAMTPRAVIAYFAQLKGVDATTAHKRADAMLERYGLKEWGRQKVKKLSKGMAQKVQLLASIAHEPEFVIFDEPFSGLDPVNQQTLEDILLDLKARGCTILFSTHVMEHAERLCDHIVLIAKGQKMFDGDVASAMALAPQSVLVATEESFDLPRFARENGFAAERNGAGYKIGAADAQGTRRLLSGLVAAGAPLTRFEPSRPQLRDVFVRLVEGQAAPSAKGA